MPPKPHDAPPVRLGALTVLPLTVTGRALPKLVPGQGADGVQLRVGVLVASATGVFVGVGVLGIALTCRLKVPLAVQYPSTTITMLWPADNVTITRDCRLPGASSLQASSEPEHVALRT